MAYGTGSQPDLRYQRWIVAHPFGGAVAMGLIFALVFAVLNGVLVSDGQPLWDRALVGLVIGLVVFGPAMALLVRRQARRRSR